MVKYCLFLGAAWCHFLIKCYDPCYVDEQYVYGPTMLFKVIPPLLVTLGARFSVLRSHKGLIYLAFPGLAFLCFVHLHDVFLYFSYVNTPEYFSLPMRLLRVGLLTGVLIMTGHVIHKRNFDAFEIKALIPGKVFSIVLAMIAPASMIIGIVNYFTASKWFNF